MICERCQGESLADCKCPDIDDRMRTLNAGGVFVMAWCKRCDKVWERCSCPQGAVH